MKKCKLFILMILFFASFVLVPFSHCKYTNVIRKTFKLNIFDSSKAYFIEYDGSNDGLLGFSKGDIVSFSRNTTLTKSEVLAKSGVKLISNTADDEYKSAYEIYGWVEDNNFYWWSDAYTVYFHPRTTNAFSQMSNIITVDLVGTDTSEVENFSNWFDTDRKLTTINGTINTSGLKLEYNDSYDYANDSDENASSHKGLAFMFNDCNALQSIDLSQFNTTNASDMKRMFGGCTSITELDLSGFDTRNVKSMYWMFRKCTKLRSLDLTNFDTENVENILAMFLIDSSLNYIYFGDKFNIKKVKDLSRLFNGCSSLIELSLHTFDTSNVNNMNSMFYNCSSMKALMLGNNFNTSNVNNMSKMFYNTNSLNVIYTGSDFQLKLGVDDTDMFKSGAPSKVKLVGGYNTEYQTAYDSNNIDSSYAKISNGLQSGYFTYCDDYQTYSITYSLKGAVNNVLNRYYYYNKSVTFDIYNLYKDGYLFEGWTGSNGDAPEPLVTINEGTTGDKYYEANFIPATIVFEINGECQLNGDALITGDNCKSIVNGEEVDFTNYKYIDTGIKLYSEENYDKDYIISFDINTFSTKQVAQATLVNSKLEDSSVGYPGLAFRSAGNTSFELTQTISGVKKKTNVSFSNTEKTPVRIIRDKGKVYYQVNNKNFGLLQDTSILNKQYFDMPVWFGAAPTANGGTQRYYDGTISNVKIIMQN